MSARALVSAVRGARWLWRCDGGGPGAHRHCCFVARVRGKREVLASESREDFESERISHAGPTTDDFGQ